METHYFLIYVYFERTVFIIKVSEAYEYGACITAGFECTVLDA